MAQYADAGGVVTRHARHDPQHEVWVGVPTEGTEVAARVDAILDALRADGHRLVEADPHDRRRRWTRCTTPELLEFLEGAADALGARGRTPSWSARTGWCRTSSRRRR